VTIKNDEAVEPDEEFYVELYDPNTGEALEGHDARTTITIIDEDKAPVICFKERGDIEHLASGRFARIPV
jgi:phenylacetate-coenzyme A ligase PaaK-like adenylate-forming protein